jgi:pilus assembly protein Flp/PilA
VARSAPYYNVYSQEIYAVKHLIATKKFFARFISRKEEGATLAEYGLLLALIAVVCIAAITVLGTQISSMFVSIAGSV